MGDSTGVPKHRFLLGQSVTLRAGAHTMAFPDADYEVVRLLPALLPSEGGTLQYLLRNRRDGRQRVVHEELIVPEQAKVPPATDSAV